MRPRPSERPIVPGRHVGLFARGRRRDDQRLAGLLASDADAVLVLRGPVVTSASASTRDLLGWEPGLCVGRTLSELIESPEPGHARSEIDALQDAAEAAGGHIATHRDLAITDIDGNTVWVDVTIADLRHDAAVAGTIVTFHDVRDRHALEQRVHDIEFRDELTGLPNRRMLHLLVGEAITRPGHLGVIVVDLDDFGAINDAYGTRAGDHLLVEVAARLAASLRAGDHVARSGGDQFTLVVNALDPDAPERDAQEVVERIAKALQPPMEDDGVVLPVEATLGVAIHRAGAAPVQPDRSAPDDLLAAAAADLRRARRQG